MENRLAVCEGVRVCGCVGVRKRVTVYVTMLLHTNNKDNIIHTKNL